MKGFRPLRFSSLSFIITLLGLGTVLYYFFRTQSRNVRNSGLLRRSFESVQELFRGLRIFLFSWFC
jgi:hypothetical protein